MNIHLLPRLLDAFVDSGYRVQHEIAGRYGRVTLLDPDAKAENGFFYEPTEDGRQRVVDELLDHYTYTDAVASFLSEPVAAIGPAGRLSLSPVAAATHVG